MPVLMYGSENWVLTDKSIVQLESFMGEMAKRALKWPRISQIQQFGGDEYGDHSVQPSDQEALLFEAASVS